MSSRQPVSVILDREISHDIVMSLLTAVRESSGLATTVRALHVDGLGHRYEQPMRGAEVIVFEVTSLWTQLFNLREVSLDPRWSTESASIIVEVLRRLRQFQQTNRREYSINTLNFGWNQYFQRNTRLYREIYNAIEELFPSVNSLRMPACGASECCAFVLNYSAHISGLRPRTTCLECVGDLYSMADWLEWMFASGRTRHLILKLYNNPHVSPGKEFLSAISREGHHLRSLCIHLLNPYQPEFWEGGFVESWSRLCQLHLPWVAITPDAVDYSRSQKGWASFLFSVVPPPELVIRSNGEDILRRLPSSAALSILEISIGLEDCGDEFAARLTGMAGLLANIARLQSLRGLRIQRFWLVQDRSFASGRMRWKLVKNELMRKLLPLCRPRRIALSIVTTSCDTCFG